MKISLTLFAVLLLVVSIDNSLAKPSWYKEELNKKGSHLTVDCVGEGPATDLALTAAIKACQTMATTFVKTDINIKMISIETEKNLSFHSEISSEATFSGLECSPVKKTTEQHDDSYVTYLKCRFRLDNIKKQSTAKDRKRQAKVSTPLRIRSAPKGKLNNLHFGTTKVSVSLKEISIAAVPKCTSLLIRGDKVTRAVPCEGNPVIIRISPNDRDILVRSDNYQTKTIIINKKLIREGAIEVFLNPM